MDTQIYIADLAAYNAGHLRGRWIDANQTVDELNNAVFQMLLESPQSNIPCTVCHDCGHIRHYEMIPKMSGQLLSDINGWSNPHKISCSDCGSDHLRQTVTAEEFAIHDTDGINVGEYASLQTVSELAEQLANNGEAYQAYVEHVGSEYATPEDFEDLYAGEYETEESFAEQFADDTGMETSNYFNWDQFTYDLFMDYSFVNGHIFRR